MTNNDAKIENENARNKVIRFKVSAEELEFIKKKSELSQCKNLSCYLRKMAIADWL